MGCQVEWCNQPECLITGLCRMHTQELEPSHSSLGPFLKTPGGQNVPELFGNFFLVTDKDGDDQLSPVSKDIYAPVSVQGSGETPVSSVS